MVLNIPNSFIYPIGRTLIRTTTPSQSEPWSKGYEGITSYSSELQNWKLTTERNLISYQGHPVLGESYFSVEDTIFLAPPTEQATFGLLLIIITLFLGFYSVAFCS